MLHANKVELSEKVRLDTLIVSDNLRMQEKLFPQKRAAIDSHPLIHRTKEFAELPFNACRQKDGCHYYVPEYSNAYKKKCSIDI